MEMKSGGNRGRRKEEERERERRREKERGERDVKREREREKVTSRGTKTTCCSIVPYSKFPDLKLINN